MSITKEEIKKIDRVGIHSGFRGSAPTVNLESNSFMVRVKIDLLYLQDYLLQKIKEGKFEISEEGKGNLHTRIKFTD